MKDQLDKLREFHKAFGHPINASALINHVPFIKLRASLIKEEAKEFVDELWDNSVEGKISANLLKEAADVLYVLYGVLVSLGIDDKLEEAFNRVHASNMSKLGDNGKPIYREDGKVLKGPNYKPPNLEDLL